MSILTTVKPVRYPGRRCARPPRADLPAAPGLALTTRRARQGPPATDRTAEDLPPDGDHHRPGHRRPLPPGPALRQPGLAQDLRHLAQHHRRPQRLRQRPRPRSPRPARPPTRPRHRRPVHLHRPAAHGANIRKIRAWRALTAPGKAASPSGHGGAAQASATTTQTANSAQPPASPPAGPTQARQARPRSGLNAASRPSAPSNPDHTAINATVRPPHHTQKQATARVLSV